MLCNAIVMYFTLFSLLRFNVLHQIALVLTTEVAAEVNVTIERRDFSVYDVLIPKHDFITNIRSTTKQKQSKKNVKEKYTTLKCTSYCPLNTA